jgi:periplasmic mercuric ion binding protein
MIKYLLSLLVVLQCCSAPVFAGKNDIVAAKYSVSGVCEQCKARIENAAYIKGVKSAEWNEEQQQITVHYDTTKTSPTLILKAIAKAGHDNERFKAADGDYNSIPKCCRYRTVKPH